MANETLIDTGPLVSLIDKRDAWHQWAANRVKNLKPPLITCESVLSECVFILNRSGIHTRHLFDFVIRGDLWVKPSFIKDSDQKRIIEIVNSYRNIAASFADACLVQMAETTRNASIFTLDSDFTIYRTSRGKPLSLISPF